MRCRKMSASIAQRQWKYMQQWSRVWITISAKLSNISNQRHNSIIHLLCFILITERSITRRIYANGIGGSRFGGLARHRSRIQTIDRRALRQFVREHWGSKFLVLVWSRMGPSCNSAVQNEQGLHHSGRYSLSSHCAIPSSIRGRSDFSRVHHGHGYLSNYSRSCSSCASSWKIPGSRRGPHPRSKLGQILPGKTI